MTARSRLLAFVLVAIALGIAVMAIKTLPEHLYGYLFVLPFLQYGAALPHTAAAAALVWGFWTFYAAILGAILVRLDPAMDRTDAVLGGFLSVWVVAFIAGNALGPLGLMTSASVWTLVLASALVLVWLGPPLALPAGRMTPGLWLAVLCLGIVGPGLLAIQLGSPLAPFMDILATPASAQRVLTFGTYQPLDSDPYGFWDAGSQCPASELLYAFLSVGSGVPYAALGQTAAIVPLAALLILAIYRLGRAVGDDRVGGFAALLLIATILFRVLPYSHGRTITYVLVAAGLAWFSDRSASAVRRALGGLMLGTAVGAHAVVGTLAMLVASLTIVLGMFDQGLRRTAAAIGLLAGAALVAAPEVAVGIRLAAPFPALTVAQLLGVLVIVGCARVLAGAPLHARLVTSLLRWALVALVLWASVRRPPLLGGLQDHPGRFPVLFWGAVAGFFVMVWHDRKRPSPVVIAPIVAALFLGMVAEKVSAEWWTSFSDPRVRIAVQGFYRKVDYWYPFVWVIPVGWVFAELARWTSTGIATLVCIAILFYPWGPFEDPNYHQQSIAEGWSQQAALAKGGYWGSTGDRRWGQTPGELEVAALLRGEIAAGRITFDTHVTLVEPYVVLYEDMVLFSVYSGVNADTYIINDWEPDISNVGGRVWPWRELPQNLATRPPYVVVHDKTRNGRPMPERGLAMLAAVANYDELYVNDGVRVLRRPDLRPAK